jgi:lysozyme
MLEGIDVSVYQGNVNWQSVALAKRFALIKATESNTIVDPRFAENWAGAQAASLCRGAYHYGHPGRDAVTQACSSTRRWAR